LTIIREKLVPSQQVDNWLVAIEKDNKKKRLEFRVELGDVLKEYES